MIYSLVPNWFWKVSLYKIQNSVFFFFTCNFSVLSTLSYLVVYESEDFLQGPGIQMESVVSLILKSCLRFTCCIFIFDKVMNAVNSHFV